MRGAELAWNEALGVVRNSFHIILGEGGHLEFVHVMEVEPRVAQLEEDGPCVAVNHEVAIVVGHGVIYDEVEGLHVLEGEDVCNSLGIVPDPFVAAEVSDCVDKGFSPIGVNGNRLFDAADVGEEVAIAEDVDNGLVVEEHPEVIE